MSHLSEIQAVQPQLSRPARIRANYEAAAECALAFARPLATGWMTFGEVESRLLPYLAGPYWERETRARQEAAGMITRAVTIWEATQNA